MNQLVKKVHVNIPFTMLWDSYIALFVRHGLNPEIGIDAIALERFSFSDFKTIADQLHKQNLTITLHAPCSGSTIVV